MDQVVQVELVDLSGVELGEAGARRTTIGLLAHELETTTAADRARAVRAET